MEKKKGLGFNIIKNDSTDGHGGYGVGAVSLNNVTPVIVDPENKEAYIEMGAMHARSVVEKGIKFSANRDDVPNGTTYWLVWVTVNRKQEGPFYHGVTACELVVDREARRGYKSMPEHVNNMDRSLKGRFIVDKMDAESKKLLAEFLKNHNAEMWELSDDVLKDSLAQ
ncbi:YwhD family protein [Bacillus sp. Marseille-P3661]|uniref:YwhD family protein n=1 Tax=Bacillus sp. Marseille-P3661 TaxID=1936234 RepID=UPI000C8402E5|nr:YwhD family protein [Bacillus sp. Marseille-P3661]